MNGHDERSDAPAGFLLVIAVVMFAALIWQNVRYRGVPDASGQIFEGCAFEAAGFAWFCGTPA